MEYSLEQQIKGYTKCDKTTIIRVINVTYMAEEHREPYNAAAFMQEVELFIDTLGTNELTATQVKDIKAKLAGEVIHGSPLIAKALDEVAHALNTVQRKTQMRELVMQLKEIVAVESLDIQKKLKDFINSTHLTEREKEACNRILYDPKGQEELMKIYTQAKGKPKGGVKLLRNLIDSFKDNQL
jgi:hypothetical protein